MKKLILFFLSILAFIGVDAAEYGSCQTLCPVRYTVTSGEVAAKESPSFKGRTVFTLNGGDIIYVDDEERVTQDGVQWVKISGRDAYVIARMLTIEDNPHYVHKAPPVEETTSLIRFGFYDLPAWLAWTLLGVWIALSLTICIIMSEGGFLPRFNGWYIYPNDKYVGNPDDKSNGPHPVYGYGMRRILFFNRNPYEFFLKIALAFIIAFVVTILLFLVIGGLVWLLCWIGRILLVALYWIIVVGGFGGAGLLALSAFFGDGDGGERIVFLIIAGVLLAIAIPVSGAREAMYGAGHSMVDWGNQVFGVFNVFRLSIYVIKMYWFTALLIALAPLVIFLGMASVFLLFAGVLILVENMVMKRYNVEHPCPTCGRPSEPAVYLSHGTPLPVDLHPGVWGLFSITHPLTGEKMPTLFLNGKDRLERRCCSCDNLISAKVGAEKHVAFAGVAKSGKSTLMCRVVSEMLRKKVGNENVCSFTDDLGIDETEVKSFIWSIVDGSKMEYFPGKTSEDRHKSLQLLVNNPKSLLPYRLYINDVAGEMFSSSGNKLGDASFLLNTEVLIMVVDPFTLKTTELDLSSRMKDWYAGHADEISVIDDKQDMKEATDTLVNMLKHYRKVKEASKISLMFTFVKTDTGYLEGVDVNDEEALRQFAIQDLGLANVMHDLSTFFKDITFHAVSAAESSSVSHIDGYVDGIFDRLGISFKRVTASQLQDNRLKLKQTDAKKSEEDKRYSSFVLKRPRFRTGPTTISILVAFVLGIASMFIYSSSNKKIQEKNYQGIVAKADALMETPNNYQAVLDFLTEASGKNLSQSHREKLAAKTSSIQTARTRYIDGLMSILYANLDSRGKRSNVEISARYGALDNLRDIKSKIAELELLIPQDEEFIGYKDKFESIIKRYNINL